MSVASEFAKDNATFAASRKAEQLPMPPARKVALVTCMDARIIPSEQLGIKEGDSHVIRNAGGRTPDALRSLIISQQLLGTQEIVVIQHTDCGMVTFKSKDAIEITKKNLNLSSHPALDTLDFLEFPEVEENVRKDVEWLKNNELIKSEKVSGWVYDVKSGLIKQVA